MLNFLLATLAISSRGRLSMHVRAVMAACPFSSTLRFLDCNKLRKLKCLFAKSPSIVKDSHFVVMLTCILQE